MVELALLIGLASFRASRLIARDAILAPLRHRFYRRFPPTDHYRAYYRLAKPSGRGGGAWQIGDRPQRRASWIGMLVDCSWCSSVWFAAAITAAATRYASVPLPALVWAAACSVAGICAKIGDA